ncbi:MAG TPA: class I SAM-dependent DNA methyltransferase, partial [Thermoanaerobaculia bacterium]|nr:class I SAM-dependent DNA methyltransferase [Thermoanaerobaculia bacterium]
MMSDALGQAKRYVETLDAPPPFLLVVDIGHCVDLFASFDGSRVYHPFPNALANRTFFADLEGLLPTLHAVWEEPLSLDPLRRTTAVTREVAAHLAGLSKELGEAGPSPEAGAAFLMRAIFTMFAEDVGLLPNRLFTRTLYERWIPHPETFAPDVQALWLTMNRGGPFGFEGDLLRFNGGLFAAPQALTLTRRQLEMLHEAARCDWKNVEPSIFGTLLERALDPKERHALGAHFTPRAYVERLVRATVEEPLRAEWDVVRTLVRTLVEEGTEAKIAEAEKAVRAFHERLCATRVLDPACGTGNFLYVTLDLFKRLEAEVVRLPRDLRPETGATGFLDLHGVSVTPRQLLGIEVKRWAKEIAELVLWIGWLQWHFRTHGDTAPDEPVLRDYGNIECRDAVLAWDRVEPETDPVTGKPVTRWDGETTKPSPVTGEPIPDETARVVVERYVNPRKAEWREAEFVVGNPPFVGNWRMRAALGDGYVEALRNAHFDVPETADLVMYWWNRAATLVRARKLYRFGLITTNSITMPLNRQVLRKHLDGTEALHLAFAIPDHPWVDSNDGAAVRVAMTVGEAGEGPGSLATVVREVPTPTGESDAELRGVSGVIHEDLRIGANVAGAQALLSNRDLSSPGVKLHGAGFIVSHDDAQVLGIGRVPGLTRYLRPYRNGKDITGRPRMVLVLDLYGLSEGEVEATFPEVYQWLADRVKPEREQNSRPTYRENWWVFGEPRAKFRPALHNLPRYVATVETAKHRPFVFIDAEVVADNKLICIATSDAFALGVLSSSVHACWSDAAGGLLEDRPVYIKTRCFDPFPFPAADEVQSARIRSLGEALDAHRKRQQALHPSLTITEMY